MAIPIYIIGSSNTDMVVKAERLPAPGETILGGTFLMNAGGKGANQAVAAARLGGRVTLVANVGNDLFGEQSILQFNQENINTNYISVDPIQPSGVALINVNAQGENCIAVAPGANGKLTPKLLTAFFEAIKSPAMVLVQLEIPIPTVEYIIEQCQQRSIPVILNPAPAHVLSKEVLRNVFLITPNETEAELLTGIRITDNASAQKAARVFHEMGIPNVVLTLGERGAYWSSPKGSGLVSVPVVTAMDTTAAGDCFNGALAVALAEDRILDDAVQFACMAASISVTRMGAQSSMPTRKEVDAHK
ncbi:MAG: ribokinase [Cyclobacteriaceae bacterium]